jgi:hypothetical protein
MSDDVEPSSQSHVLSPGAKKELGDDQVEWLYIRKYKYIGWLKLIYSPISEEY